MAVELFTSIYSCHNWGRILENDMQEEMGEKRSCKVQFIHDFHTHL